MIKIAIIGATGYTGSELVRLLTHHPGVETVLITSETHQGKHFSDIHPQFKGICDIELQSAGKTEEYKPDLVFLALPHGVSMEYVKKWHDQPFKIIDLSGDFRLSGPRVYSHWYHKDHSYPDGFKEAAFGLPELFREQIRNSRLIANPGCFPTGAILACYPLLKEDLVDPHRMIFDSKTGVTGAGVKPKEVTHYPNVGDNFKPYGIKKHRHTIEIQETLALSSDRDVTVQFTPHLLPVDRGILTSLYAFPVKKLSQKHLEDVYQKYYQHEFFIRLRQDAPQIKHVRGTNYTDISVFYDKRTDTVMVFTALDNLVKGAAGQAIQNMNIMMGLEEKAALELIPMMP
ncbi:MAG TPA: N-acetyl-gamma-glutamyl-phosphate reductase [Bacteroidales bacterium]|nr:N-acetyl-gamma-glutamyl-phosphate reductase [Bacteroidales bacterium]